MAHSKVFTDGDYCIVLVAHVQGENEVSAPGDGLISGLLEYSVDLEYGDLYVYDGDDYEMYAENDLDVGTIDKDAIRDLVSAIDDGSAVNIDGSEYWNILKRYQRSTDDPEGALSGVHPVGTIIRIDYGGSITEADAFVRRSEDYWEVTGGFTTYTDEEIESEEYEVIYSV